MNNPSSLREIDLDGFRRDMDALRARTLRSLSRADFDHLRRIEWFGRGLAVLGYGLAWMGVNPLSVFAIALAITIRWMVMHHVGHGGYERIPGIPERYRRKRFALGRRRWLDWLDWIEPAAWNYSHNQLHHYHTSEPADPDRVERNVALLRDIRLPRALKYVVVLAGALTWKLTYYAPNALNGLESRKLHTRGAPHENFINLLNFWDLRLPLVRRLWARSVAPYLLVHFVLVPCLFLPLGEAAFWAVLVNRILAELLANLHTFVCIVPSHAADDLALFDGPVKTKDEFYLRQVLTTANYRTGGDVNDVLHMWINYQIEHHLFPDLPMSTYREIQPEVAALCAKYGVPYVQESVFARLSKLLEVFVGSDRPAATAKHVFPQAMRGTLPKEEPPSSEPVLSSP